VVVVVVVIIINLLELEKYDLGMNNMYECKYKYVHSISTVKILLKLFLNVIIINCGFSGFCLYANNIAYMCFTNLLFLLVWFGLFVHPFSHTCNTRHVNYRLQFIYYNTIYNIWTSTQYSIINNNTKFKDQLEVESVITSRNMCIYINICIVRAELPSY